MKDASNTPTVPAPGTLTQGGHFVGVLRLDDEQQYGIVVAPKAQGERAPSIWHRATTQNVEGATSFFDGFANTNAMAAAGSALAKWARGLAIADFADWYLPSRDELELCYRHLKPSTQQNWVWRNGDNPSSEPVGYPYAANTPGQTVIEAFRKGGDEAFDETWYWTSTQYAGAAEYAWYQYFGNGNESSDLKYSKLRARAVRRFRL